MSSSSSGQDALLSAAVDELREEGRRRSASMGGPSADPPGSPGVMSVQSAETSPRVKRGGRFKVSSSRRRGNHSAGSTSAGEESSEADISSELTQKRGVKSPKSRSRISRRSSMMTANAQYEAEEFEYTGNDDKEHVMLLKDELFKAQRALAEVRADNERLCAGKLAVEKQLLELQTKYDELRIEKAMKPSKKNKRGAGTLRPTRSHATTANHASSRDSISAMDIFQGEQSKTKMFGVALREFFSRGITVPIAVSNLVSTLKSRAHEAGSDLFTKEVSPGEARRLVTLLDFGEALPQKIDIYLVSAVLREYFRVLPEPLVLPDSAVLMMHLLDCEEESYMLASLRGVVFGLPYNHRILLQYMVSFLSRLSSMFTPEHLIRPFSTLFFRRSGSALEEECGIPEHDWFADAVRLLVIMMDSSEAIPISDKSCSYKVSDGKMATRSATVARTLNQVLNAFSHEEGFRESVLGLSSFFISNDDFLNHIETAHSLVGSEPEPAKGHFSWKWESRLAIVGVMRRWIELNPQMLLDKALSKRLRAVARSWTKVEGQKAINAEKRLRKLIHALQDSVEEVERAVQGMSSVVNQLRTTVVDPLDLSSTEEDTHIKLAREMTLIDAVLFHSIPRTELVDKKYMGGPEEAPKWNAMVTQYNKWSGCVIASVLAHDDKQARAAVLVTWVRVANYLHEVLNNYNSSYAIMAALTDPSLSRLKGTFEIVPERVLKMLAKLEEFWSISRNFKTYRDHLAKSPKPCIPYIGLVGKDLFQLEDAHKKTMVKLDGSLHVNIEKLQIMWGTLSSFVDMQTACVYELESDGELRQQLLSLQLAVLGEKEARARATELAAKE